MWLIPVIAVGPCQCFSPGGKPHHIARPHLLNPTALALSPSEAETTISMSPSG
jgi:hypothetical protein